MALSQQDFDAMDKIANEGQNIEFVPYEPEIPPTYQEGQPIKAQATKWANISPSGLIKQGSNEIGARLLSAKAGMPIEDARTEVAGAVSDWETSHPVQTGARKALGWLGDQWLYGGLGKLLKVGPIGLAGITGGFEATKEGKNPIKGALESAGIAKALGFTTPYINQAKSAIARTVVNSEKWKNLIEGLSGVSKKYTERLKSRPEILTKALQKIKRNPDLLPDDIYAQDMKKAGADAFNKYQEIDRSSEKALVDYVEQNKNTPLQISNKELAQIFDKVFKKHSSNKYNAYQKSPNLVKDIQEELSGKPSDLLSLDNLKRKWQNEATYVNGEKIQASKYSDTEEKIAKDLARRLNEVLRTQHPEYARLNDIRHYMNDFAQRSGLNAKNIGDKFKAYGPQASGNTYEILNELNEILPAQDKFIDKIFDAQTVNMFLQKQPVASTTEQILARKALPYVGLALTGGKPAGYTAGITASGGLTSPQRYGRMTLEMLNKAGADPNKITPAQYRALKNQARVIGNIVSATLPREEEEER